MLLRSALQPGVVHARQPIRRSPWQNQEDLLKNPSLASRWQRPLYLSVGFLCLALGVVALVIPLIPGIVFLVFCSGFAGTSYSWKRNLKIAAVLVGIAFAFQKLLGVSLPLY